MSRSVGGMSSSSFASWLLTSMAFAAVTCCVVNFAMPVVAAENGSSEGRKLSSGVSDSGIGQGDIVAFIDAQIRKGWADSGYTASPKATDAEWCRRAFLDVIGRVPTVVELN